MESASVLAIAFGSSSVPLGTLRHAVARALPPDTRIPRARDGIVVTLVATLGHTGARAYAESARKRIAQAIGDADCGAGIGGPRDTTVGAHVAMLQAEQALCLGRALRGPGRVTSVEDLGPYCFVLGQPTRDIRDFCERVLGPLAEDEELTRTLEVYLRAHGSLNEVARRLFLHRNTVRLRLRRIAKLTGADLKDADSRLALHLAILGRQALERLAS